MAVNDLNEAAEAWFVYADRKYGKPILVPSEQYPGKKEWVRPLNYSECVVAHGVFLDGFLAARGWQQDQDGKYLTK